MLEADILGIGVHLRIDMCTCVGIEWNSHDKLCQLLLRECRFQLILYNYMYVNKSGLTPASSVIHV